MTPEQWERVKEILQQVWECDPSERAQVLDRACAQDPELRAQVTDLLAADDRLGTFLAKPLDAATEADLPVDLTPADSGRRIGPYRILREIGHGGMGTVYLAERADGQFRKRVALKLVNPHLGREDVLRRFRNERQVLAALDHPNIARLLDGGVTNDGLPYLVMEYVDGVRIDTWCDARKLPVRDRLRQFRKICEAVQYAHEHQIIHRDLKPGNILVTVDGTPQLLDFGIAKLLNKELSAETLETTAGLGPMTPEFASPEQIRGEPVSAATDVYALGMVLYLLLTGRLPYSFPGQDFQQIARVVCEHEPLKPSAVLGSAETHPESPATLRRLLAGDLDNIVLKALRKDPERRYASAAELSADLDRFLQDLPVQARREGLAYRGRKFLKRNRASALTATVSSMIVLALALGIVRLRAPSVRVPARSIAILPLVDLNPEKNQEYFSEGLAQELRDALAKTPELRVAASGAAVQFRGKTQDPRVIGAKLNVATILEGNVRKQGNQARIAVQLIQTADGFQLWSETFDREMDDIFSVEDEITRAVAGALKVRLLGETKGSSSGRTTNAEAHIDYLQGQFFLAESNHDNLEKSVHYFEQATKLDPAYAMAWAGLGEARSSQAGLAYIPVNEGFRQAREAVQTALSLDANLARAHAALGEIQMIYDWDWSGADASYRRASAIEPANSNFMRGAASLARILGRLDEAIALDRHAIEIDPLNPLCHSAYKHLAMSLYYAGRQDEAAEAVREALQLKPSMIFSHSLYSQIHLAQFQPQMALAEANREPYPAFRLTANALAYHALGQKQLSDANLAELIARFRADAPYEIAQVYAFRGEPDRAIEWLERAYDLRDGGLGEMKTDPLLKNLRNHSRYARLLRKMHLAS
jgi:eukaryotic-like serine/threonine-protein kinase